MTLRPLLRLFGGLFCVLDDIQIIKKEIQSAISDLRLDLTNLTLLTEAASEIFGITPLIGIMAGAKKVMAVSKNSKYGLFEDVKNHTYNLAERLNIKYSALEIYEKSNFNSFCEADIVTNLGHLRPIDKDIIRSLKTGAVISYMCESWEYREGDLDLNLCRQMNIPVMGINESHPKVNCFWETGLIALKIIMESRISLANPKITIVSRDKFGKAIYAQLKPFSDKIALIEDFSTISQKDLQDLDILVVADYLYPDCIIGRKGIIDPDYLKKSSPYVKVIQFCGNNKVREIKSASIPVFPDMELEPVRMCKTLGSISYRSFIRLIAGGLKVGEIAARKHDMIPWETDLIQKMN